MERRGNPFCGRWRRTSTHIAYVLFLQMTTHRASGTFKGRCSQHGSCLQSIVEGEGGMVEKRSGGWESSRVDSVSIRAVVFAVPLLTRMRTQFQRRESRLAHSPISSRLGRCHVLFDLSPGAIRKNNNTISITTADSHVRTRSRMIFFFLLDCHFACGIVCFCTPPPPHLPPSSLLSSPKKLNQKATQKKRGKQLFESNEIAIQKSKTSKSIRSAASGVGTHGNCSTVVA